MFETSRYHQLIDASDVRSSSARKVIHPQRTRYVERKCLWVIFNSSHYGTYFFYIVSCWA